jgi:uncharacterized protein
MPVSARELFAWHARPGAFERLTPGWQPARVRARSGNGIRDGSRVTVAVPVPGTLGLVHQTLEVEHRDYIDGQQFRDVQVRGPFASWNHLHRVERGEADDTSVLEDRIEYEMPLGPIGAIVNGQMESELARLFAWRHARTRADLQRHAAFADRPRLRVGITGGTGMVGRALTHFLTTGGHTVRWITRRPESARGDIRWDPDRGTLDQADMAGLDAVVHLAGANVGERWTAAHKRAIRESRERGTRLIARALAGTGRPEVPLISMSATGYYGDAGGMLLTEESPAGPGFLADTANVWEAETQVAAAAGHRVAITRMGVVLDADGGALAKMLPAFLAGVGGRLGSGAQYLSWITLTDAVYALHHLLMTPTASGVYNLVAPTPVTNAEFVDTLGRVLSRPTVLPVPAFALTALFGEMAQRTILEGQRAVPARLQASGYVFEQMSLESALRWESGRMRAPADG